MGQVVLQILSNLLVYFCQRMCRFEASFGQSRLVPIGIKMIISKSPPVWAIGSSSDLVMLFLAPVNLQLDDESSLNHPVKQIWLNH
jgi:hypothetical protein